MFDVRRHRKNAIGAMRKLRCTRSLHRVLFIGCLVQALLWLQWNHLRGGPDAALFQNGAKPFNDSLAAQKKTAHSSSGVSFSFSSSQYNATTVNALARPFHRWAQPFPCFPAESDWNTVPALRRPIDYGFMYFKARKAGSSTLAGVAMRIARSVAKAHNLSTAICQTRFGHPPAWYVRYNKRDKKRSFLWSVIREPTKRHISEFFHFAVSRGKVQPTDANFQFYLQNTSHLIHNYYLKFMKTDRKFVFENGDNVTEAVEHIMREYNFIGILERMDESLVALQMILNLKMSDILYLNSKVNGGFDDGVQDNKCYYIVQTYVSPTMRHWFETSPYWRNFTIGDNLLYQAVNKSLDLTIERLGREEFQQRLSMFRMALQVANAQCSNVTYPCSPGGVMNAIHDCIWTDLGCGFDCLDGVAKQLRI